MHKNTSNFIPSNIQWTLFYNLLIYTPILNIRVTMRKLEERRLRHLSLTSYHTSSPLPSSSPPPSYSTYSPAPSGGLSYVYINLQQIKSMTLPAY